MLKNEKAHTESRYNWRLSYNENFVRSQKSLTKF